MSTDGIALVWTALEHVPMMVLGVCQDGRVHFANARAIALLGRTSEQLKGTAVESLLYGDEGQRTWDAVVSDLEDEGECVRTVNLARSDGSELGCELRAAVMSPPDGTETFYILFLRDTTEETQNARRFEEKNIQMARMNAELVRTNAQLRRISELKSNFLSLASHELKTPLTSIKGYSDIIIDTMKSKLEPGIYSMVSSINRASDRLHRVVNNILDATRMEKRKLRLSPEETDLAVVVREALDELQQFASQRHIVFELDCQEGLPGFYGDRMRMQQVCVNLFSNALKYSPDNSAVQVRLALEDGDTFHLSVRDSGIGIPLDEQSRVFMPFYELGSVTKHFTDSAKFMGGGAGLGLSIVKGVVERHGGRVWVESEGNRSDDYPGCTFHVVVPVRPTIRWDDDATLESAGHADDDGGEEGGGEAPRKSVAVVIDPDEEAGEVTRMALESEFTVHVARDGGQGLSLAYQHRPDVVVVERGIPVVDGCRLCRLLRSQDETAEAAIAFFSESPSDDELRECFASGADDYVVKPIGTAELRERIKEVLRRKRDDRTHRLR